MRATLLAAAGATLLATVGCIVVQEAPPVPLPPPPPAPAGDVVTYDYTQTLKKDISEDQRIESVIQSHGDRLEAEEHQRVAQDGALAQNRTRFRTVERRTAPRRVVRRYTTRHYHAPHYYTPRYRTYYAPRHYRSPGIGNTVLFGTLGGIIGHQSGHRDEGILIGAGYGLFRDLLGWGW